MTGNREEIGTGWRKSKYNFGAGETFLALALTILGANDFRKLISLLWPRAICHRPRMMPTSHDIPVDAEWHRSIPLLGVIAFAGQFRPSVSHVRFFRLFAFVAGCERRLGLPNKIKLGRGVGSNESFRKMGRLKVIEGLVKFGENGRKYSGSMNTKFH